MIDNQIVTMRIKTKTYSTGVVLMMVLICLLSVSCERVSVCFDGHNTPQTAEIRAAEEIIWSNPDSCRRLLASVRYDSLPLAEQMYWHLLHEHANQKGYLPTSPDSIMPMVIAYFSKAKNYRYLGEAYYVQGLQYNFLLRHKDAMHALKNAEMYIPYQDTLEPYAGMIYYKLGKVCESEQLYTISEEYYLKSVPYLMACNSHYYLAYCYNDISRTHPKAQANDTLISFAYYQKALHEAKITHNQPLYYDIMYQYELNRTTPDSAKLFQLGLYMVDSLGLNRQAAIVAEHYMNHGDIRKGAEYLNRFAQDTVYSAWAKLQYRYLQSLLYSHTHHMPLAYSTLQQVYHDLWIQLQEDADARIYAISRHYDLEREQTHSLQLQMEKQHLRVAIIGIGLLLLISVLTAMLIISHLRNEKRAMRQQAEQDQLRAQAEQLRAEEQYIEAENKRVKAEKQHVEAQNHIMQLHAELQARREILRQNLRMRIELTKRFHQLPEQDVQHLSQTFKDGMADVIFSTPEHWQQFLTEFDDLYANMLARIRQDHPKITDKDLQYIALAKLNMSVNDICYLLGITERTIWNRRQRIKNHLDAPDADLDQWLENIV